LASLDRSADYYGEGLALGNGEVRLLEMVQGYAVLARLGLWRPLRTVSRTRHAELAAVDERRAATGCATHRGEPDSDGWRVFDEGTASLIGHILSDPQARSREFGTGGVLQLPVGTAVKTGTSNDHRDLWALGYSDRHTVGVWMGNLDRSPTRGITGSTGPAMVLRAVFAELNRHRSVEPVPFSSHLQSAHICAVTGQMAGPHCPLHQEWFVPGTEPRSACRLHPSQPAPLVALQQPGPSRARPIELEQPTPGLKLAMDPRIPDELEAFALRLPRSLRADRVEWMVDDSVVAVTGRDATQYAWPLERGRHTARARIWLSHLRTPELTPPVTFQVK
jgi:penicillin-binding protein 1C